MYNTICEKWWIINNFNDHCVANKTQLPTSDQTLQYSYINVHCESTPKHLTYIEQV